MHLFVLEIGCVLAHLAFDNRGQFNLNCMHDSYGTATLALGSVSLWDCMICLVQIYTLTKTSTKGIQYRYQNPLMAVVV